MNNNILKIQKDLFFLSQKKKNVPENRHEKRRDLPAVTLIDYGTEVNGSSFIFEELQMITTQLQTILKLNI